MRLRTYVLWGLCTALFLPQAWAGTAEQEATLLAFDGQAGDEFGGAVAVEGNTAMVGAALAGGNLTGAVYVFEKVAGAWTSSGKLTATDPGVADFFGSSVDLDGDTALIGAPQDEAGAGNSGRSLRFRSPGRDVALPDPSVRRRPRRLRQLRFRGRGGRG